MATATVLEFMHKTAKDAALRQQLEALLGVGDGDISNAAALDPAETAALEQQAPVVAEFAAHQGFAFSPDELITVVDALHKHQTGELSHATFAELVGGGTGATAGAIAAAGAPLQRLKRYLSKTYLGIDLA